MENVVLLFLQIILTTLNCFLAVFVVRVSQRVSRVTPSTKAIGSLQIEQAELRSLFDSLMDSHKRLRSRVGMKELRGKRTDDDAPPAGSTKQELRAFYLKGKSHTEVAKLAQTGINPNG